MAPNPFATKELHTRLLRTAFHSVDFEQKRDQRRSVFIHHSSSKSARLVDASSISKIVLSTAAEKKSEPGPALNVPRYAWTLHDMWTKEADRRQLLLNVYNMQIIIFTAATIIIAVFYARYFEGYPALDDYSAIAMFAATVALPLCVPLLIKAKKEISKLEPLPLAQLESEIFKFRAQVAAYDNPKTAESNLKLYVKRLVVEDASVQAEFSEKFWDNNSDANAIGDGNPSQNCTLDAPAVSVQTPQEPIFAELPCVPYEALVTVDPEAAVPTETTAILSTDEKSTDQVKDRYSMLTVDDYMEERVGKVMTKKKSDIDSWEFRQNFFQNTIKVITLSASATALVSMQWAIPILLAFTAAAETSLEFASYEASVKRGKELLNNLERAKGGRGKDRATFSQIVSEIEESIVRTTNY